MDKKAKKQQKKDVEAFFKESGLDFMDAKKMKALGIECIDDCFVLNDEDIRDSLNPVQRRKFLNAVRQHPKYGQSASSGPMQTSTVGRNSPKPRKQSTRRSSSTKKAKAMYAWTATGDEQLDVQEGEIVTVLDDDKKWWRVRNSQGMEGTVPSNFFEKLEDSKDDAAPPISRAAKPLLPDEEEECIYEPVTHPADPADAHGDFEEHDYEDPDAITVQQPGRPAIVRSEIITRVPDAEPLPADPKDWLNADVLRWLKQEDLKDFTDVFYANGFDGASLITLHSSSFKAGGFDPDACDKLQLSLDKLGGAANTNKGRARALYDYDQTKETQLSFREGEDLEILDDSGAWWKARNSRGKTGSVPSNYLERLPDGDAPSAPEESTTDGDVTAAEWYLDCDRKTAERLLNSNNYEGEFLVRPSQTTPGDFTLTALGSSGIMNLKIQKQQDGMYVLGQFSSQFASIFELVRHHKQQEIRITGKAPVLLKRAVRR